MSTQSPEVDKLAVALTAAQAKLSPAIKGSVNPHFKSKYADLQAVWEAARPVLTANNLSVIQSFSETNGETVTIVTTLLHASGQWMRSALTLKPSKADPQGIGSAITYGRRYGLSAIIGIVADEDDDGNAASQPTNKTSSHVPTERPHWKEHVIHFGKNANLALKELPPSTLEWYQAKWFPKPFKGEVSDKDKALRAALDDSIIATAPKVAAIPPPKANAKASPVPEKIDEDVPF